MPKPIAAVLQTMERVIFKVSWSPKADKATLERLTCNDIPVKLGTPRPEQKGSISVEFAAPRSGSYNFSWTLLFPGLKLKNLKAEATLEDSEPVEVDSTEEGKEMEDRWKSKRGT
ncbi:hypothetical protein [Cystobacter fuscus]|uniref:hypothetical protein n=1 Tax=Cystobacter fuscus TaxID=43 RepID=UPI002B27FE36|nr:hypothetical protein F0U63_00200 [Cystobacter fuscus]